MNAADIEQRQWEELASRGRAAKQAGKCTHGSCIGSRPCTCRECGKQFPSFDDLIEERHEILAEF